MRHLVTCHAPLVFLVGRLIGVNLVGRGRGWSPIPLPPVGQGGLLGVQGDGRLEVSEEVVWGVYHGGDRGRERGG